MANLTAAQPVQAEIEHTYAVTLYDFSVKGDKAVTPRFGAQGPIGMQIGQEKVTFSFKFFAPATGLEFDWNTLSKKVGGFTITFSLGAERHQMYGCRVQSRAIASNPETGDVTYSADGAAIEWLPIS